MVPMGKNRYFIYLSYLGKGYYGWQVQPGRVTIQGILEDALSTILQEDIKCTGAGRTDTGVSASYFVAHFDSENSDLHHKENFIFRLNRYLPPEIAINSVTRVRNDAHARFSATSRSYVYVISRKKNPFTTDTAWFMHGNLDVGEMNRAALILKGYTDFTSFSRLHSDVKTNNCNISSAEWIDEGDRLVFRITADRFLRNMVRAIVGTMTEIGCGKLKAGDIRDIIEARDRSRAGKSARAEGLTLVNISYPADIFTDG